MLMNVYWCLYIHIAMNTNIWLFTSVMVLDIQSLSNHKNICYIFFPNTANMVHLPIEPYLTWAFWNRQSWGA